MCPEGREQSKMEEKKSDKSGTCIRKHNSRVDSVCISWNTHRDLDEIVLVWLGAEMKGKFISNWSG